MMHKSIIVVLIMIVFCFDGLAQGEQEEKYKDTLSNHYGLLICMGASIPVGIIVSINIVNEYMHSPGDSALYQRDNKLYRVSDFNNDVTLKLGAFLLVDILVMCVIGDRIDDYRKQKRSQKNTAINFNLDPLEKKYSIVSKWSF